MSGDRASIAGRVLDDAGTPVHGASVAVSAGPGMVDDIAALTDTGGRFRLGNLVPGRYRLAAFGSADANAEAEIEVGVGERGEVEIRFGGHGPEAACGVTLLTGDIDWNRVRLVRVSLRETGAGQDAPAKEFLFSPSNTGSAVWETAAGTRYTYTASYFLDGGLQRTVGPVDGEDPTLVLDPRLGDPPP
jgi:hypothetical protein